MQRTEHAISLVAIAATSTLLCTAAPAQPFANAAASRAAYSGGSIVPAGDCERLAALELPELVEIAARQLPAEGSTPAHCRVSGLLDPEIGFEVNLPTPWNGRLYMIGNGGHAGQSPDDPRRVADRRAALEHGFAMASTNTGHDSREEPGGTFVLSNPQKAIDYAYRAVHLTAVTAKAIANRYYAEPVANAYWNSCSNGGRQGLLEAQRYPDDFDGIIANAPWVDQTGFTLGALWNQRVLSETPITSAKLELVAEHVMRVCDAVDGLSDGLIDDPRQCAFDAARDVPSCSDTPSGAMCLSTAEAAAIQKVYDGPVSNGQPLFPGFMVGSEAPIPRADGSATSGWMNNILAAEPGATSADFRLAQATMRYLVFDPPQPDWDYRSFDFDRDPALLERWGEIANATDTNLQDFRAGGGKLIMTYGWADTVLQPLMGVDYYEQARAENGPDSTEFMRLFMIPGMAHCSGGNGPDRYDAVTAVIDWVETGAAPDALVARKVVNGRVTRSRPLCPYPQVARHKGQGSIEDAASFECVAP